MRARPVLLSTIYACIVCKAFLTHIDHTMRMRPGTNDPISNKMRQQQKNVPIISDYMILCCSPPQFQFQFQFRFKFQWNMCNFCVRSLLKLKLELSNKTNKEYYYRMNIEGE